VNGHNLQAPFRYDLGAGNLLLDVRRFSAASDAAPFDIETTVGDSISRVVTNVTIPEGVDSPVGRANSSGLVTRFTVAAVPEPASLVMLGSGILALIGYGLHPRSQARA
jgi:PEP-CTERM motif